MLGKMRPGRLRDCAHHSTSLAQPELLTVSRESGAAGSPDTVNPGVPGFDPEATNGSLRSGHSEWMEPTFDSASIGLDWVVLHIFQARKANSAQSSYWNTSSSGTPNTRAILNAASSDGE